MSEMLRKLMVARSQVGAKVAILTAALLLAFGGVAFAQVSAQGDQCIANALAGGTPDAITIPLLPCSTNTNLLLLTVSGANTSTVPTLTQVGSPTLPITKFGGKPLAAGDIPVAGYIAELTSTGSSWNLLNPATILFPALTGDVTTPLGSSITSIAPGAVTSGKLGLGASAGGLGWSDPRSPPFNAKCDGSTDDSTALIAWASVLVSGSTGYVPGICIYKTPLIIAPTGANNLSLLGNGSTSQLLYAGASTTNTTITIGQANVAATGCSIYNFTLHDVTLLSSTVMTGGDAIQINSACQSDIENFYVGTNLGGTNNWYNGAQFFGGNTLHVRGYQFVAKNKALILSGDNAASPGPYQFTDPFFTQGIVLGGVVGINVAGGVGGFTLDQSSILLNNTNILVDQSVISRPNVQLFFEGGSAIDATSGSPGIGLDIEDPGFSDSFIMGAGAWFASAGTNCIKFGSGTSWIVHLSGGRIINCGTSGTGGGILNNSVNNLISISGTLFDQNGQYGFNNAAADVQVNIQSARLGFNGVNSFIGNPISATYADPSNNLVSTATANGSIVAGTTQIVGGGALGSCGLWYQAGVVVPGLTDFSTAGCSLQLGSGTFPIKSVAASQWLSTGSAPTISGTCTANSWLGGNTAGKFVLTSVCTTAQSFVLTFANAGAAGWNCNGSDASQAGVMLRTIGFSTTTATIQPVGGSGVSGDNLILSCVAF